jgi:hypothetical protein
MSRRDTAVAVSHRRRSVAQSPLLNHPLGKINRSTLPSQVIRFSGQKLRSLIPDCCRISLRGNRRSWFPPISAGCVTSGFLRPTVWTQKGTVRRRRQPVLCASAGIVVGISGIRYVKYLILLVKPLSSSSCHPAASGSPPVRRGQTVAGSAHTKAQRAALDQTCLSTPVLPSAPSLLFMGFPQFRVVSPQPAANSHRLKTG